MKILKPIILAAGIAIGLCASVPARADTFTTGEFVTYTPYDWVSDANAIALLQSDFVNVYAATAATLTVGTPISMYFDSASAVSAYLPTFGNLATLNAAVVDPTSTSAGVFGGDVTALALDVDFSNYGALHGTSSTPFGNLILVNFNPNSAFFGLNGVSVSQFLALSETALGGGSTDGYTLDNIDLITAELDSSFESGNVSEFATDNLECPGACTAATPLPGALPLFVSGLGVVALFVRRRTRKAATVCASV